VSASEIKLQLRHHWRETCIQDDAFLYSRQRKNRTDLEIEICPFFSTVGGQMAVTLTRQAVQRIVAARRARGWTQSDLSWATAPHKDAQPRVSTRTIADLESRRRLRFTETTLAHLCRALDIPMTELVGEKDITQSPASSALLGSEQTESASEPITSPAPSTWRLRWLWFILPIVMIAAYSVIFLALSSRQPNSPTRIDWAELSGQISNYDIITPEWKIWREKFAGRTSVMVFNRFNHPRTIQVGDSLQGEFACSYRYIGGSPEVFISLYREWLPDEEVRLFHGVVEGDSTIVCDFKIAAPPKFGLYRIRVFYTTAFSPVASFYGSPPENQVTAPSTAPYVENVLEVLPRNRMEQTD